jgi:hypothetical protein
MKKIAKYFSVIIASMLVLLFTISFDVNFSTDNTNGIIVRNAQAFAKVPPGANCSGSCVGYQGMVCVICAEDGGPCDLIEGSHNMGAVWTCGE